MWIAYKTIVIKEILRFSRIWVQTIFPPIITTSLYLLIFGGLMGERIGDMQGVDYALYYSWHYLDDSYSKFLCQYGVLVLFGKI